MVKYLENKNSGFNSWAASSKNTEKKSSNFFLWLIIFLLSWWLFATWMSPKKTDVKTEANPVVAEDISNVRSVVKTDKKLDMNVQGLRLSNIKLKDYNQNQKSDDKVSLFTNKDEFMEIGLNAYGTTAPNVKTNWISESGNMVFKNNDGIKFTRSIVIEDYLITVKDEIKNNSGKDVSFAPYVKMVRNGEKKTVAVKTGAVSYTNTDIDYNTWRKLDKKPQMYSTVNGFAGFSDQYWETVASIVSPDQKITNENISENLYKTDLSAAPVNVANGETKTIETRIFAGPKIQNILSGVSDKIPGINETIDYGWFWFLAQPMLYGLTAINNVIANYGLSIIFLTIILRILIWPLTRKSYTSMVAMQKMQPELMRIQKLYKNDKMRLQMEMMKLYQTHKASPMSGCLPMLLQIPIFFALYKALLISVPMRQAGFLWMSDLSVMDPFFILPIIMGATMWWQQKLQSTDSKVVDKDNPAAQMQSFMKWMPLLFTVMFAWMPAGLVLYWTISNIFGIGQIYVIKKQSK